MPQVKGALTRALTATERRALAADVRALLAWQESLAAWRRPKSAIPAIPFVALYVRGQLRACMGNDEGTRGEKLARAFLSAIGDPRFGGIRPGERRDVVAEVSFMRSPRLVEASALGAVFEAGTHGIGLARPDTGPVFLLPSVARDGHLDATGMLEALRKKAGRANGELFLFETESVVVRRVDPPRRISSEAAAAAWLASLIEPDGDVTFAIDARTGARLRRGEMHHARSAAVIDGLSDHGRHGRLVTRAREHLATDCRAALRGDTVEGWSDHPARIAATLALAARAGADLGREARAYAEAHAPLIAPVAWHAAQVVTALGEAAPDALWKGCVQDLDRRPWAPWTLLAALAKNDDAILARCVGPLLASIRPHGPHAGAVVATGTPEVAVTALTVEALSHARRTNDVRRALRGARSFLARSQLLPGQLPAAFDPEVATGAFLAAPTSSVLRGDITGHALRALL